MNTMPKLGALYMATSPSGKRYVGITVSDASKRWRAHCKAARRGDERSLLYRAIRKHGAEVFELVTLAEGDWASLNAAEELAIKLFRTQHPNGYNLRAGGSQSRPHQDSIEKQRKAMQGRSWSDERRSRHRDAFANPEVKERQRLSHLGKKHSAETKAKMSAAHAGRVFTPEHMERLWTARRERKVEIARKISLGHQQRRIRLWRSVFS